MKKNFNLQDGVNQPKLVKNLLLVCENVFWITYFIEQRDQMFCYPSDKS